MASSSSSVVQFDNVFHNLLTTPGKLRFTQGGLGWKPASEGATHTLVATRFKAFQWLKVARGYQLRILLDPDEENDNEDERDLRRDTFDGFAKDDYDRLAKMVRDLYDTTLDTLEVSTRGWNWGKANIEEDDVRFYVKDRLAFEMPIAHIANSNIAGKTEVSMEFAHPEGQQPSTNGINGSNKPQRKNRGDQLVEMRLHVPGTVEKEADASDADDADADDEVTAATAFHDAIKRKADIGQLAGDGIVVFKDVLVLTPRGRYDVDMFPTFLRLHGKSYDYKILYQSINRLFLLPKPDEVHVQFVIGLDPPIRQGQTRYPFLVFQFPREEEMDAELNLDEETIQTKYEGKLKKRYEEPTFRIVTNIFKVLSGQKLTAPGTFSSTSDQSSVKCNVKATEGLLYPLDKSLLWVSKQPIWLSYTDVHQVIFSRVGMGGATAGVTSSKTFDLRVLTRATGQEHTFASISRDEYDKLNAHFADKRLRIKNEMNEETGLATAAAVAALEGDDSDADMDDDDDGSDGGRQRKSKKKAGKASKAAAAAAAAADDDDDSDEDDEDFEAPSEDDGGSPSEASSDEEGGGGGGGGGGRRGDDDNFSDASDDSSAPKKKKAKK